jgi:hypothetical protein
MFGVCPEPVLVKTITVFSRIEMWSDYKRQFFSYHHWLLDVRRGQRGAHKHGRRRGPVEHQRLQETSDRLEQFLYIPVKTIILPRQARDKHRKS